MTAGQSKFKGLRLFLEEKSLIEGHVITRSHSDFGVQTAMSARRGCERQELDARILSIPAPMACYWLSE